MNLKQFMVRNQHGYFNRYLVFTVHKLDIDEGVEDDDDSEKPSSVKQDEGKLFSLPKVVYLKSNLRRIEEHTSTLYLKRTEETYKLSIVKSDVIHEEELVQESVSATTDEDFEPPLNWIPSNEVGQIFAVEEEIEEVEEIIEKKTKRVAKIDNIFPVRETAAKEDLEILRMYEGVQFILDEDFKQFTEEEEEKDDEIDVSVEKADIEESDTKVKLDKSIDVLEKDDLEVDAEKELIKQEDEETEIVTTNDEVITEKQDVDSFNEIQETNEAELLKTAAVIEEIVDSTDKGMDVYEPKKIIDEVIQVTEEKIEVRDGVKVKQVKKTVKKTGKSSVPRKKIKDGRLSPLDALSLTDEEKLNTIKQIVSPVMSSLLVDVFECVVEEQIYSINKEYSEVKNIVTDVINSLLNRMIQDVTMKNMQRDCICRQKRELALKEKKMKRVCKCRRRRIVASKAFVSRRNTVDKAIQHVMYEIYSSVPNKKYLDLQEVHLDSSLVTAQLLKMKDLIYLDIELSGRRTVTIPPEFYQLSENKIRIKGVDVARPFNFIENWLHRPLPAVTNGQEFNEIEIVDTKIKTPTILIMRTKDIQQIYEILHVPSNLHDLNIVINTTGLDVKIKPTSRRVVLTRGKLTSRLT